MVGTLILCARTVYSFVQILASVLNIRTTFGSFSYFFLASSVLNVSKVSPLYNRLAVIAALHLILALMSRMISWPDRCRCAIVSFPRAIVTSRDLLARTGISFGWLAPRYSTNAYDSGAAARVVLVRPRTASAMSLTWALSLVIAIVALFVRRVPGASPSITAPRTLAQASWILTGQFSSRTNVSIVCIASCSIVL
jgi:hypothetical protein